MVVCAVPTENFLRSHLRGCSTGRIYFSSRLKFAEFWSTARAEHWLVRICKTRVVLMTFIPRTEPTKDAGAVKVRNLYTDRTRRCYCRSSRPSHLSISSRELSSLKRIVLKNICFMILVVVSHAKWARLKNTEKEGLLVVWCFRYRQLYRRKRLPSLL